MTSIGDVLWGLDNKAAFEAALTYLPFGWRVAQGSDRLEFRFNSVHKGQYYVIRWRRTKPEGWVCFHARGVINVRGQPFGLPRERKMLPGSFSSPVAAAAAIHLAGGV